MIYYSKMSSNSLNSDSGLTGDALSNRRQNFAPEGKTVDSLKFDVNLLQILKQKNLKLM